MILSGVGGDELFGGYRRYLGNHYQAYFGRLPAWCCGVRRSRWARGCRATAIRRCSTRCVWRKDFSATADLPFEDRYRSYVQVFSDGVGAANCCALDGPTSRDPLSDGVRAATSDDDLNRMLAVDAETQLPDDLLLLTDKMSMAVSLECRVPLLDHELVELAARMPRAIKIRAAAQAPDEGRAQGRVAAGHPGHARSAASARRWVPGSRATSRRWSVISFRSSRSRLVDSLIILQDRGLIAAHEANSAGRHGPTACTAQPRDLGAHLSRRRTPADVADELKAVTP